MRNEGSDVFFRRQIPIINVNRAFSEDNVEVVDKQSIRSNCKQGDFPIEVQSDKDNYLIRSEVKLSLNNLPPDLIDLVISVVKADTMVQLPAFEFNSLLNKQPKNNKKEGSFVDHWIPEYEGHILMGRMVALDGKELPSNHSILSPSIGVVGKDIRYMQGQVSSAQDPVCFYTGNIYGKHEVVTAVSSLDGRRIRLDLLSPFNDFVPKQLPVLSVCPDAELLKERSICEQLSHIVSIDSVPDEKGLSYYGLQPHLSYDLDSDTRFNTISETIVEFVRRIDVSRVDGKRRMRILLEDERRLAPQSLILLDGVVVNDHEDLLNYNAHYIKRIDLYNDRYLFGGKIYDCIASFVSLKGTLPSLKLKTDEQLFVYDFPIYKKTFPLISYAGETAKLSRIPDFRHTIYWDTFMDREIPSQSTRLFFYTSNLTGTFKVSVTGIRSNGEIIRGITTFRVIK
ncbi:hypothetical protein [Bacteroides sp. 51]|uniref:hypothetical protein n=1 Tax=Bacteroides sp. 51 TaxID=2302938 RepID=UPI0013D53FE5|nr:hypothetical protein [Bacteroides sp. 51]